MKLKHSFMAAIVLSVLSFGILNFSTPLQAQLLGPSKQGLDCRYVYPIQQAFLSQHVNYSEFTPEIEIRTVEQYLKRLDPSKMYLLEDDVKTIKDLLAGVFSKVKSKDCSPLIKIQNLIVARVKERAEYAKSLLGDKFKFDPTVEIMIDRDKVDYPKTKLEAEQYVAKYIQFQISNYMLTDTPLPEAKDNVKKTWDRTIKRVFETKEEELIAQLLDAFARALDPHSSFMARDNNEDFKIQMSLSLQGIGATLSSQDGFTTIESLVSGGPAAKSGLLIPQDKILAVAQNDKGDFENVVEMDLKDVVKKIRGPKGSKVRLKVLRKEPEGKKTFTVTLTRDKIKLEDDAAQLLTDVRKVGNKEEKFGIINLPSFYSDGKRGGRSSSNDVKKVIEQAKAKGVKGLVLDLSMNGGGSLDDAVKIAGLFFKTGNVVTQSTKEDPKGLKSVLSDEDQQVNWDGPLVVLVSRVSASASEIVSGTLQDYKRALVLGSDHTFGKGTVQTVIDIPPYSGDLGAIKVTVGTFFIPGGYSTQHRGVLSDIKIPGRFDGEEMGEKNMDYSLPPAQLPAFLSTSAYVKDGQGAWSVIRPEWVKELEKKSKGRVEKDPEFKKLFADLEKAKMLGKTIKVSEVLNEKDKKQKEKEIKSKGKSEKDKEFLKRAELQEAINVLADLYELEVSSPKAMVNK